MSLPLPAGIERVLGSQVAGVRAVAGGDVNDAYVVTAASGARLFVKTSPSATPGMYAAEAAGLRWLAQAPDAPCVPQVRMIADPAGPYDRPRMLVLEHVESGALGQAGAERLGRELAALHRAGADAHGALPPRDDGTVPATLFVGPLALPLVAGASWPEVYGPQLLMPVARIADARGMLPAGTVDAVAALAARLPELAGPEEPPARLHGDLWSGNVIADTHGAPYLIDPAAYGGHREIDLAMLRLFGGPPGRWLDAYAEVCPLAPGHEDRVALYQLFPALVHAALFGGGYGPRALRIARHYL